MAEEGGQELAPRLRGPVQQVSDDVADALFLPPCVLKVRKKQRGHWASASSGWRPNTEQSQAAPFPALAGGAEENLFVQDARTRREYKRLRGSAQQALVDSDLFGEAASEVLSEQGDGDSLAITPKDEPYEYELLSPEESKAKEEIWDEVNKDLLESLHDRKMHSRKRKRQEAERKIADRWQKEQKQLLLLEQARARRRQGRSNQKRHSRPSDIEDYVPSTEEEDEDSNEQEADFWEAHAAARQSHRACSSLPPAYRTLTAKEKMEAEQQRIKEQARFARSVNELFGEC